MPPSARPNPSSAPTPATTPAPTLNPAAPLERLAVDPAAVTNWDEHYRKHEETPVELMVRLTALREKLRFRDIEAALKAYLRYRGKHAEPWMYELLALAIKKNKGSDAEFKTALAWGAYLAKRGESSSAMTQAADLLVVNGYDEIAVTDARGQTHRITVGELLDRAAEKDPQSPRAALMAMNYALRTKDPKRMGDAIERFLSLGWPGKDEAGHNRDEAWRLAARRQVEALAEALRQSHRDAEADALLDRLRQAETRDLVLRLTWTGDADLDLVVEEPLGARACFQTPRTVFGGALVKNGYGKHPEEVYTCPRGFSGDYKVQIETIYNDEKDPATRATLEIVTHEGTPQEHKETRTIDLGKGRPAPIVVHLDGGRRTEVLPYKAPPLIQIILDPKTKAQAKDATTPAPKPAAAPPRR
ncbi:MAG: hypothetical protein IRY99_24855 [Isosphaeraceae bacterium]|nr:hypothetical protein [Isosphaeraceae bacterium]